MFEITRATVTVFGLEIHWYGVLIALGIFGGVLLAGARERKMGLPKDTALDLAICGVPAALLGARLYYVAFSWEYYAAHPADILNVTQGGLAIYGGVIGGVLAGWVYARVKKISFASCLDLAAPAFALGQAVGRWGNFLNQEAYGRLIESPALRFFPFGVNINGSWHYATFFYESIWCALIVALILLGEKRGFFRRKGDGFWAYVFLYALERTLVEGLRTDSLYLGTLRVSQVLSLLALLAVTALLCARAKGAFPLLRILPGVDVLLLAAGIALESTLLILTAAILLPGLAYVLYNIGNDGKP